MVDSEAMTAVKVSYSFTLLNSGAATLIGVGSASVMSRAIGKKIKTPSIELRATLSPPSCCFRL